MMARGDRRDVEFVRELCLRHRNWGRWGDADELGTMNLVTPQKILDASRLVTKGSVFSLALPLDSTGPMNGRFGRFNPVHVMLADGGDVLAGEQGELDILRYSDDAVFLPLQCSTQWDALAHIFFDGLMYNGYHASEVTSRGARKNSITALKDRVVTRGVLLDIARHRGKPWLEPGEAIEGADLAACAAEAGLDIGPGDVVLIRTGGIAQVEQDGEWNDAYRGGDAPGIALSCADFLCPLDVAAVATDTWGTEVRPNETPDVFQPLHLVMLVNAGIHLGEMWYLEELAADCARDGVFEFLLVAPPLTITGAVGSPVNPQAIK
jgi:kynurenine formamidase